MRRSLKLFFSFTGKAEPFRTSGGRAAKTLDSMAKIYYARLNEFWRKEQKYQFLEEKQHIYNIEWQEITPDAKHNWLTAGMHDEFETFIPLGTKEAKADKRAEVETIFKNYGRGVETARDNWAYNFNQNELIKNAQAFIETYNEQVSKWHSQKRDKNIVDSFVLSDDKKIKWSSSLKADLLAGQKAEFSNEKIRTALYRPFVSTKLFFDENLTHRRGQFPQIFPISKTENQIISISDVGARAPFSCLSTSVIPDFHLCATADTFQCFPFYVYSEDGANRRENVTDWALKKFREHYGSVPPNTKRDIFHYVYAVLHHPVYREKYAANLKKELPRVPFAPEFWSFADAGEQLAALHVNYETQKEYPLEQIENREEEFTLRVEKMRLSKDKSELRYNRFLTLRGIPPAVYEYRLGNRSALEWIVEQYQVTTDARSGITNDPNRQDDPNYILRLVGQIVTVSLETVRIVRNLATLSLVEQSTEVV